MARRLAILAVVLLYAFISAKAAAPGKAATPAASSPADKVGALDDYIGNDNDADAAAGPISDKPDSYVAPTTNGPLGAPPSIGKNVTSGADAYTKRTSIVVAAVAGLVVVTGLLTV